MQLTVAQRSDFIQIARQTYSLWSGGLTRDDYRHLLWSTCYHPWARRNSYRLVHKIKDEVISSCKVVSLPFLMKGKEYEIWGLGSVFTAINWRNKGLGSELIESVLQKAKEENIDGVLLFSAIDSNFYSSCGFRNLGSLDFQIRTYIYSLNNKVINDNKPGLLEAEIFIETRSSEQLCKLDREQKIDEQNPRFHFSSFYPWIKENDLEEIVRCYSRWLIKQPYGIIRTYEHYAFQLAKFLYFSSYSKNNQCTLFLTIARKKGDMIGYAITEYSGTGIRILELIGTEEGRAYLWHSLIKEAQKKNLIHITGYESGVGDFIPSTKLDCDILGISPPIRVSGIQCYQRFWSQPMCFSLNSDLETMTKQRPCPVLEFDYF